MDEKLIQCAQNHDMDALDYGPKEVSGDQLASA